MKKYKILIGKNVSEFERIVKILLANGHVFSRLRRVKTYEGIVELMGQDGISKAQWFVLGYDKVCKNVVGSMRLAEDESDRYQLRLQIGNIKFHRMLGIPSDYEDVTVEQYIKIRETE